MERQTLQAEVREGRGKGPARQLRMQGRIPAVVYGPGLDPKALSVSPKDLVRVLSTPYRRNALIEVVVDGETTLCMVRELQAHPVTEQPLHVDLYRVDLERPVKTTVPFETSGRAVGVQRGGKLRVVFRELPVMAKPEDVPAKIVHDVTPLDQGQQATVADLSLPEGLTVLMKPERTLVAVEGERKKPGADDEGAAAEEAPAG